MDALSNTDLILAITGLYASLVVTMTNLSGEFNDYCLISEESNEITYDLDNAAHVGMTANIIDPFSGRPQTVDSILLTLYEFTRTAANEIGSDQEIKNLPNLLFNGGLTSGIEKNFIHQCNWYRETGDSDEDSARRALVNVATDIYSFTSST